MTRFPKQLVAAGSLVAVFTLTALAPPVHASNADDTRSVTVHFQDLNLGSDAGAKALYRRISAAARAVCGSAASVSPRLDSLDRQLCVEKSTHDAVAAVGAPALTLLYARHAGAVVGTDE